MIDWFWEHIMDLIVFGGLALMILFLVGCYGRCDVSVNNPVEETIYQRVIRLENENQQLKELVE